MYLKDFEIRWSDVDANRHLANAAYLNFMSHSRMTFLIDLGFDQQYIATEQISPVVFYEHMYYFKEVFLGATIQVSVELKGMSADAKFFEFHHNFYNQKGENVARCETMGGWIHLKNRKLTGVTAILLDKLNALEKTADFKVLTREDTRAFSKTPKALNSKK